MQYSNSYTFMAFFDHVRGLLEVNRATGVDHSQERIEASAMNVQRIKRLNKTAKISPSILSIIEKYQPKWNWTLIVEGWCGDAAQITPYINKLAAHADQINLEVILRDENPEVMDNFLTNNGRAIPILVCHDAVTNELLGHWGPRPKRMIDWIKKYKAENPESTSDQFKKELHTFYAKDKGQAINEDLLRAVESWLKTD